MRAAVISHNARQFDAIGNHIADLVTFLHERQAETRVYVESSQSLHPALRDVCHAIDESQRESALQYLETSDIVFFQFGQAYSHLHWLPFLAEKKPRLIFDYHCVTPPSLWSGSHRQSMEIACQYRKLAWCADAVWVYSRFARRELQNATGIPSEMMHVIGFHANPLFGDDYKLEKAEKTQRTLLFVGRLAPNKCVPLLIDALARMRDLTPAVHAVIVGDDGDVYANEKQKCLQLAQSLGVSERVQFRAQISAAKLQESYQSADVFVMPSVHEGFCIPVIEAMANGLPIVAARAAALPETVGDAGVTFHPNDADDLARQIRRIFESRTAVDQSARNTECRDRKRIGVVAFRFGEHIAGGAEQSLRTMAKGLQMAGCDVEIFTTCTTSEDDWRNELPPGTVDVDGLCVHRFPIDVHNRKAHLDTVQQIKDGNGKVTLEVAEEYLRHSVRCSKLINALSERIGEFDALIAGPYLFGVTADVARAHPEKTLVATCFHDEPLAYLPIWPALYGSVGGLLFHSDSEKRFAESVLGVNHPNSHVIGTLLDETNSGRQSNGSPPVDGHYLLYCGRYSPEKNLPQLIDYAKEYHRRWPDRFRFVFMGRGSIEIPKEPWAVDLGFVSEHRKREVIANARALVQLSRRESLSIVALEAWRESVPVIADAGCDVLADLIEQSNGGATVSNLDDFVSAINDLWMKPDEWERAGERGREFVRTQFSSHRKYCETLLNATNQLATPLSEQLRMRGLQRASLFSREQWEKNVGRLMETCLEENKRTVRNVVEIQPQRDRLAAGPGQSQLVSIRVANHGTHAMSGEGLARIGVLALIRDELGNCVTKGRLLPLPGILAPGETTAIAMPVTIPESPGDYRLTFQAIQHENPFPEESSIPLVVEAFFETSADAFCRPFLDDIDAALIEMHEKKELPTSYLDVTNGWFAKWKQRAKQKLLNNFKKAYVDVLSRQQTEVNQQSLFAMQRLAECCETLQSAVAGLERRVADLQRRVAELETPACRLAPDGIVGVESNSR